MDRRNFLKKCGTAGIIIPPMIVAPRLVRAGFGYQVINGPIVASCSDTPTVSIDGTAQTTGDRFARYNGMVITPSADIPVCQIDWKIGAVTGDISGKTYTGEIWSLDGGYNRIAVLASFDNTISGNNSWNGTWITYTKASPYTLSSGSTYAILYDSGSVDTDNCAAGGLVGSDSDAQVFLARWNTDGTLYSSNVNYERPVKIYGTTP